ncbi:MAG: hypothetical protein ACFE75_05640 [Candidatus Hodarchaeota archaeon]
MFNLILLFIDIGLFILSLVYLILDINSYREEKNEDLKRTNIPKRSKFALLFGLLSLVFAVIISIGYP